ncbi:rhodanese-like domain-containing protein [Pseudomonas sp. HN2-3]|uniref:rhodanese-like domain-containing protein n=1 Tax=Pseudomonas sp. HN2-3 TaxID=2886360 RepID=UPI001D11F75B|nr:rhodanese-like domain-containing protein [Pseudomonas sp. HN2-3]UDU83182.1 rhodanese-like domain-containing protein [Pseudomonas sp. HN2-3]
MKAGEVMLLDVRPGDEFAEGHLPGALNIQLDQLVDWLEGMPEPMQVVAYCRMKLSRC